MFPPFSQEAARHYCIRLISLIESGDVVLKQCGRESEERKGQGVMLGALVCWNKQTGQRVVLYAVSGNNKQLEQKTEHKYIFVPSIVSSEQIDKALEQNDFRIHELTAQINKLTLVNQKSTDDKQIVSEIKKLSAERALLTDESLKKVFSLYSFMRFDGKTITLNEIIKAHDDRLPPTGTGDCCAPKLLSYAFANGLEPVSMDEVYYGRDTAHKKNGFSYTPCDERCG